MIRDIVFQGIGAPLRLHDADADLPGINLWPAIILHVGLNALWLIFALGENAVGGWFGNAVRLAVVIFAIAGTLMLAPRKP